MAIPNVNPGDLIKAADWNALITFLNAMDVRLTNLENNGTGGGDKNPHITQVLPSGPVTAGDTIRIFGSNFDFLAGGHSVFFGSTRAVTFLPGSSDTVLIVVVPDPTAGATLPGASMTLTVGNLISTTTQTIVVKSKPIVTTGNIQFSFKGTRPTATPTQNSQFFYDFDLTSAASEDLTVTITPTIAVVLPLPGGVSDPNLPSLIAVLDADQTVKSNGQVSLPEGTSKTVSLRLSLPNNVNLLRYSLSATASAPGVSPRTETLAIQQVGAASEQPDPTINSFEFSSIAVGDAVFSNDTGGVSGVDGTVSVRASTTATIEVNAAFGDLTPGSHHSYQLTAVMDPATPWSTAVNVLVQNPLQITGPAGATPVFIDITAPAAPSTAVLHLTLTHVGVLTNNKRTVSYRVNLR